MAIVEVQSKIAHANSAQLVNVTPDANITAGSLLICVISIFDAPASGTYAISDDQTNSWSEIYETVHASNNVAGYAYAMNANSGSTTVTVDSGDTGNNSYLTAVVVEVSGIKTSAALDQNNENNQGAQSDWDSNNITTTEDDEYLLGFYTHSGGNIVLTEDSEFQPYVQEEEDGGTYMPINVGSRIVSSTLTESYSGTTGISVEGYAAIASFEAIAAAAGLLERQFPRGVLRGVIRGSL
jgi:hypothetical protein